MSKELVLYTHPMSRGRMIRWLLEEIGTIEKRPEFETYWAGLGARPAFGRAMAIDEALLAQQTQA